MKINVELRNRMLQFFLKTQRIEDFKSMWGIYNEEEIKDMRIALLLSGDLEHIHGLTQSARYQTTVFGRHKLDHS